jgi:uncharacterized ferritin-like protein (DUF455 family)
MTDGDSASLFDAAARCLAANNPDAKIAQSDEVAGAWRAGRLALHGTPGCTVLNEAGRPSRPRLVDPRHLPRRKLCDTVGHAAFIHAITHIEFNAINLAWDAVQRFRDMPPDYYSDWIRVAQEECRHFQLLRAHLRAHGYDYGDFDAHDGLWHMARRTADDVMLRMALVPRVMEARGLDVTPAMICRLQQFGDRRGARILGIIWREEVGHVAIGTRWYRHACAQRGLPPDSTFAELLDHHLHGALRGPFDHETRSRAGFSQYELEYLDRGE